MGVTGDAVTLGAQEVALPYPHPYPHRRSNCNLPVTEEIARSLVSYTEARPHAFLACWSDGGTTCQVGPFPAARESPKHRVVPPPRKPLLGCPPTLEYLISCQVTFTNTPASAHKGAPPMIEVIELDHLTVRSLFGLVHALFPVRRSSLLGKAVEPTPSPAIRDQRLKYVHQIPARPGIPAPAAPRQSWALRKE